MCKGEEIESFCYLTKDIKKFRIKIDQAFLVQIAKSEAVRSPWYITHDIQNYGIKDQNALFEIAALAAMHSPYWITYNIGNFHIEDEKKRVDVAKIAFRNCSEQVIQNIENFGITSKKDVLDLFLTALEQMPVVAMRNYFRFRFYCNAYSRLDSLFGAASGQFNFTFAPCALKALIDEQGWTALMPIAEEQIFKIKDSEQQKIALTWFSHFLGRCLLAEIPLQSIDWLVKQKIIQGQLNLSRSFDAL